MDNETSTKDIEKQDPTPPSSTEQIPVPQSAPTPPMPKKEDDSLVCPICGFHAKNIKGLKIHMDKKHNHRQIQNSDNIDAEKKKNIDYSGSVTKTELPNIEEEKKQFLEQLDTENTESLEESSSEQKEELFVLTDDDFGELYISLFGLIAEFVYKIDIYEIDNGKYVTRLNRRGKVLNRLLGRYLEDSEIFLIAELLISGGGDFLYLMSYAKAQKEVQKRKEKKKEEQKEGVNHE